MVEKDPKIITLNNESTQTSGGYQVPDRIVTSSSGYAEETPEQKAEREAAERALWEARGYEVGADGKRIDKASTLGDILKMKDYAEQVEKANKIKATNAGVYNTLTLLGDMISAGVGGDVHKREKNTIAEDAIKDTQAKKEAVIAAEKAAKEKDRERLAEAQKAAEDLRLRYAALRDKVSSQTTEGYYQPEVKTTTTNEQEQVDKSQDINKQKLLEEIGRVYTSNLLDKDKEKAVEELIKQYNRLYGNSEVVRSGEGQNGSASSRDVSPVNQSLSSGAQIIANMNNLDVDKGKVEPKKIEGGYKPTGW